MILKTDLPENVRELNSRYADLLELKDEPETLAALWETLAGEYDDINYRTMARRCRAHAAKARGDER